MVGDDLGAVAGNAVTGVRALGLLLARPVAAVAGRDPTPAVRSLVERQNRLDSAVLGSPCVPPVEPSDLRPAREAAWLAGQAVLGPAELVLATILWLIALIAVSAPLWWWTAPPVVIFVPVTNVASSFAAALFGVLLVVIAATCTHGLPKWHARVGRVLLDQPLQSRLTRRVATLTASRAGALEVHAAELRRIERDLHDGAQARLVSTSMSLALLDMKLGQHPDSRRLLAEARAEVGEALQELRDLVRGVYPPILADRGLTGGIESLADRAEPALASVNVVVEVDERLPVALETTVYFFVAEALTNVTKHSAADRVDVTVRSRGTSVHVEVRDDGKGGADELRGSGIAGLRRRVAAFDGSLTLHSPVGGPTILRAELPCVS